MAKYKKYKKQVLFVTQNPSFMQKIKEIEATGEEFNIFSCKKMDVFFYNMGFPYISRVYPFASSSMKTEPPGSWELIEPILDKGKPV